MGILKKITVAAHNRTTYRVGLLQAKAYRILKDRTRDLLSSYDISTIEWAMLGLLYEAKALRPTEIAEDLGVEAPFVTVMVKKLSKQGLLSDRRDAEDSRAKVIFISDKGKEFVSAVEPIVRAGMRPLLKGSAVGDILGYVSILEGIIQNASNLD